MVIIKRGKSGWGEGGLILCPPSSKKSGTCLPVLCPSPPPSDLHSWNFNKICSTCRRSRRHNRANLCYLVVYNTLMLPWPHCHDHMILYWEIIWNINITGVPNFVFFFIVLLNIQLIFSLKVLFLFVEGKFAIQISKLIGPGRNVLVAGETPIKQELEDNCLITVEKVSILSLWSHVVLESVPYTLVYFR